MKLFVIKLLGFICVGMILWSCGDEPEESVSPPNVQLAKEAKVAAGQDWNVSFLLDLSDRISPEKYPNPAMEYYLRDAAYIEYVADLFDAHMWAKPVRSWNDKIQVYFDPEPSNQNINTISQDLKFHFNRQEASVEILKHFEELYQSNPTKIYELAIADNHYVGSDIWRFFSSKIKPYAIDPSYRNILILLTDGYIYHKDNLKKEGNRTSYLTPQEVRSQGLDKENWREMMNEKDFGFIPATSGLDSLEVLVLNINPSPNNAYQEDVLRAYWSKWFNEMKVKRYSIQSSALPTNMEGVIKDFLFVE